MRVDVDAVVAYLANQGVTITRGQALGVAELMTRAAQGYGLVSGPHGPAFWTGGCLICGGIDWVNGRCAQCGSAQPASEER